MNLPFDTGSATSSRKSGEALDDTLQASSQSKEVPSKVFTLEEIQPYNGRTNELIYVALLGKVYDVTAGVRLYGPGIVTGIVFYGPGIVTRIVFYGPGIVTEIVYNTNHVL